MATVLITGGTGTIGKRLTELLLEKNYEVIILTREPSSAKQAPPTTNSQPSTTSHPQKAFSYAYWDVEKELIDKEAIAKADYIIHLAGAGVADKRWTAKRKKEIVDSRTKSSTLLIKALTEFDNKVSTVVSASAIGWYGADTAASKQKGFKEDAPTSDDFLSNTCKLWEESIEPATALGKRVVKLRTGIVLNNGKGALEEFKKPLKAGIAAILGGGSQVVSWIHIEDMCRTYIFAIENKQLQGWYNAVAPMPVTNQTLTLTLAKLMRGKAYIPVHVPSFVLKIMLGEMSSEVLKSANVCADKIRKEGFSFLYPSIEAALKQLVK